MSNVEALAQDGLTPDLRRSMGDLLQGIAAAIKHAQDQKVPVGLIVGQLEFYKAALIQTTFNQQG